jgi:hypothetical protein
MVKMEIVGAGTDFWWVIIELQMLSKDEGTQPISQWVHIPS